MKKLLTLAACIFMVGCTSLPALDNPDTVVLQNSDIENLIMANLDKYFNDTQDKYYHALRPEVYSEIIHLWKNRTNPRAYVYPSNDSDDIADRFVRFVKDLGHDFFKLNIPVRAMDYNYLNEDNEIIRHRLALIFYFEYEGVGGRRIGIMYYDPTTEKYMELARPKKLLSVKIY